MFIDLCGSAKKIALVHESSISKPQNANSCTLAEFFVLSLCYHLPMTIKISKLYIIGLQKYTYRYGCTGCTHLWQYSPF